MYIYDISICVSHSSKKSVITCTYLLHIYLLLDRSRTYNISFKMKYIEREAEMTKALKRMQTEAQLEMAEAISMKHSQMLN